MINRELKRELLSLNKNGDQKHGELGKETRGQQTTSSFSKEEWSMSTTSTSSFTSGIHYRLPCRRGYTYIKGQNDDTN